MTGLYKLHLQVVIIVLIFCADIINRLFEINYYYGNWSPVRYLYIGYTVGTDRILKSESGSGSNVRFRSGFKKIGRKFILCFKFKIIL